MLKLHPIFAIFSSETVARPKYTGISTVYVNVCISARCMIYVFPKASKILKNHENVSKKCPTWVPKGALLPPERIPFALQKSPFRKSSA